MTQEVSFFNRYRNAAQNLADYMMELSEEIHCAGWNTGIEEEFWEAVNGKGTRRNLSKEQITKLQDFAEAAGGWIDYDDVTSDIVFVPMAEWKAKHP